MEKDYYKILGVSDEERKLTGDEFKKMLNKKFRALSLKYHPDKYVNKSEKEQKEAEEKFKEITEANTVLSDPKARAQYDNGGMQGMDLSDFMRHFGGFRSGFGAYRSPFADFFGGFEDVGPKQARGNDVAITVTLTLEEAFRGCYKEVDVQKEVACSHCNGTGSEDGKSHKCQYCNGTGMITETQQRGNIIYQQTAPCPHCKGTGTMPSTPCKECNGTGVKHQTVKERIQVPPGIDNGMTTAYTGKGSAPIGGNGINGDLIVKFVVKQDDYFTRVDAANVIHYEYVPFNECLLGFKKECRTLDGGKVYINAKECTKDGDSFMFRGMGFPRVNSNQRGDYAVVVKYVYPDKLTDKQKEMLKNFNS